MYELNILTNINAYLIYSANNRIRSYSSFYATNYKIIALHVVCVIGFERCGSNAKSSQIRHAQLGSI